MISTHYPSKLNLGNPGDKSSRMKCRVGGGGWGWGGGGGILEDELKIKHVMDLNYGHSPIKVVHNTSAV